MYNQNPYIKKARKKAEMCQQCKQEIADKHIMLSVSSIQTGKIETFVEFYIGPACYQEIRERGDLIDQMKTMR